MRVLFLLGLLAATALGAEPDAGRRPRVAVLYFEVSEVKDEDLKLFSKALAEMTITDLLAMGHVDVVERARLEEVLTELKLGETRFADQGTFARAGKLLGADYLVTGSIYGNPKIGYMLGGRIVHGEQGTVLKAVRVKLDGDDVYGAEAAVVEFVGQQLRTLGAIGGAPQAAPPKRGHRLPLSTATKFARALDAKDKKDKATAVKLLTEVVKEQPEFKLAQLDLLSLTQ